MRIRMIAILLIATLIFTTAGCSSGNETDRFSPDYIEQIVNPDRSLFYGETITIATDLIYTLGSHANLYMRKNPGVNIHITSYHSILSQNNTLHDFEREFGPVRLEIATQLMAGAAPTLINASLADPFDPRQATFFYDWYLLMESDPNFNEDDWFMNAFHAFAIDGQLNHFPLHIMHTPVVANMTIPGLLEAMAEKAEGITMPELMALHLEFSVNHPHLLEEYFNAEILMRYYLDRFVDIETGRVDFGQEFIDLLIYAEGITGPGAGIARRWRNSSFATIPQKIECYLFHFEFYWHYYRTFLGGDSPFASVTPLVNDQGELLIDARFSYLLNTNATPIEKAIAWDFLMFAMQVEHQQQSSIMALEAHPTSRNLFHDNVRYLLPATIEGGFTWFSGPIEEGLDHVITAMTAWGEMPMRSVSLRPRVIDDIVADNLRLFHDGLLSAEQTAQNLQDQIALVLMEMAR